MAKLLTELPPGLLSEPTQSPAKPQSARPKVDGKARAPKALQRPSAQGTRWINSQAGNEWMMRRCEEFGFASSRYFKKTGTCPKPTKNP